LSDRKRRRYSINTYKALWAYAFLAVPIVFYLAIRFYPTFNAFYLSLTSWNIVSVHKDFVGAENYRTLVGDPLFWQTLGNTFKYVLYGLPIGLVLSFIIAYLLNKARHLVGLLRALYFIPYITSLVAVSWVWRWLYQKAPIGLFNNILVGLGLPQQGFLMDLRQALPSILAPTVWASIGFQFVIFLAGLKSISPHYYEVADIDGAGEAQKLFFITLPLLRPTIIFLVITQTIGYLRIFTQVLNMTFQGEGGPLNATKPIVLYIYQKAFMTFEMGYAAALSVVLFVLILAVTLAQLRLLRSA
jgi:multiple sugar transport system permease protein